MGMVPDRRSYKRRNPRAQAAYDLRQQRRRVAEHEALIARAPMPSLEDDGPKGMLNPK